MPIGNGPDIEQFDRKAEEQQRLYEKVDKWWYDLDDNYKFELIEPYYPDKAHLMSTDVMWKGLNWNDKLDIYYGEHEGVIA